MKCKDVMTPNPRTCTTAATLQAVAQIMKEQDVGLMPVVDKRTRQLVGVVTDRDLALEVAAELRNPAVIPAGEVMKKILIVCKAEDDISACEDLMKKHQIRRVPVVDDNGCCVGIIAQADIALKVRHPEAVQEVVREISKPHGRRAA
jgi:CBS domain-containing protein